MLCTDLDPNIVGSLARHTDTLSGELPAAGRLQPAGHQQPAPTPAKDDQVGVHTRGQESPSDGRRRVQEVESDVNHALAMLVASGLARPGDADDLVSFWAQRVRHLVDELEQLQRELLGRGWQGRHTLPTWLAGRDRVNRETP